MFSLLILISFKFLFSEKIILFTLKYILVWSLLIGIFFPILGVEDLIIINFLKIDLLPKFTANLIIFLTLLKIIIIFITNFLIDKNFFGTFRVFIIIVLILNFLIHFFLINKREEGLNLEKISKYSNTENIITLSFDGVSNLSFEKGIKNNKKFLNAFKDFSFYNNINGHSSGTYVTLIYELYGGFDKKIDYKRSSTKKMFLIMWSQKINCSK